MGALSPLLIEKAVRAALEEDLGPSYRDVTSELTIPAHHDAEAILRARKDGVLSGLTTGLSAFTLLDGAFDITVHAEDGDAIEAGQTLATIAGPARELLMGERVALNFMGHMSGIATLTAQFVKLVEGTGASIVDTRKTLPGLRGFQKYAVQCGGGVNHRNGLYDAILIKDNHIAIAGGIDSALNNAGLLAGHTLKVEIEVDTLAQLEEVLAHGGADIVLLDNMGPDMLADAVKLADGRIQTEASGNVSLETVRAIAESGVGYISIGALTHSAPCLDLGLDIDA